jgi:hypothetical protein
VSDTPEQIAAWVRSSCDKQGIPVHVTDSSVLRQVVALLGSAGAAHYVGKSRRMGAGEKRTALTHGVEPMSTQRERPPAEREGRQTSEHIRERPRDPKRDPLTTQAAAFPRKYTLSRKGAADARGSPRLRV